MPSAANYSSSFSTLESPSPDTGSANALSVQVRSLRWAELGEDYTGAPAQDEEFVLMHADNVQATGFLEHIKLPHYVDFQSELELIRNLRAEAMAARTEAAE